MQQHARNASRQCFVYLRYKFGDYFTEEINHPEDDNGFDLFYPEKLKEDAS